MSKRPWIESNTLMRESFKAKLTEKAGGGLTFDSLLLAGAGDFHQYNKVLYPECTGENFTKFLENPESIEEKLIPNTAENRRSLFASNAGGEGKKKRVAVDDHIRHKTDSSGYIQHHSYGKENAPGYVQNITIGDHSSNHSYSRKKILIELKNALEEVSALEGAKNIWLEYIDRVKALSFSNVEDDSYDSLFGRDPSPIELDAFAMIKMTNYIKKSIGLNGFKICYKQWASEDLVHKDIFNFKDLKFSAASNGDLNLLDKRSCDSIIMSTSIITSDRVIDDYTINNPFKAALPVKIDFARPLTIGSGLLNISGVLGAKIGESSALICFTQLKDTVSNPNIVEELLQKTIREFKRKAGTGTIIVEKGIKFRR